MKKSRSYRIFRFVFSILFLSFLVVYFSSITGYYEYQNYKKSEFTKEQIKQYEKDIKEGKQIDMKKYLSIRPIKFNNSLSKISSIVSEKTSDIVKSGVEGIFKYVSKLVVD